MTEPFEELARRPAPGKAFFNTPPYPSFPRVTEDMIAAILFPSGTTARPEGVTYSHTALGERVANHSASAGLNSEQLFVCMEPLVHLSGLAEQMLPALHLGATLLVCPSLSEAIERRVNAAGQSRISYEDYAVALIDEATMTGIHWQENRDVTF